MVGGLVVALIVVAAGPASSSGSSFRGFVNPMRQLNPEDGKILALNLSDAENPLDLRDSIIDYMQNRLEYEAVMDHLGRYRKGEGCDTEFDWQNVWPHIEKIQKAGFPLVARYVNVGAANGQAEDPLYSFVRNTNATGVAIEANPELCAQHRARLPDVYLVCEGVTPQNVVSMLMDGGLLPGSAVDVMKVDIDSYDCFVLEVLLEVIVAKLVVTEVNPSIPPPYQFAMLYHPGIHAFYERLPTLQDVPMRGCSLSYVVDLLRRHGYDFLGFGGHDAMFAHESVREAWLPMKPPMDEFSCYNNAYIAANGIPISLTRRWFYQVNDTGQGLSEIFAFFVDWMQSRAPQVFPFALRS